MSTRQRLAVLVRLPLTGRVFLTCRFMWNSNKTLLPRSLSAAQVMLKLVVPVGPEPESSAASLSVDWVCEPEETWVRWKLTMFPVSVCQSASVCWYFFSAFIGGVSGSDDWRDFSVGLGQEMIWDVDLLTWRGSSLQSCKTPGSRSSPRIQSVVQPHPQPTQTTWKSRFSSAWPGQEDRHRPTDWPLHDFISNRTQNRFSGRGTVKTRFRPGQRGFSYETPALWPFCLSNYKVLSLIAQHPSGK